MIEGHQSYQLFNTKKCRALQGAAFEFRYYSVGANLRSSKDIPQNASRSAAIAVATVSITAVAIAGILPIALVIAT